MRLNQVIALEAGTKARTHEGLTQTHHALQKPAMLTGLSRTYQPLTEGDEVLPAESTKVQADAETLLELTGDLMTILFDVVATKDWANTRAVADVVVDGKILLKAVPVTYLMFLEKQLVDLATFVRKLPVLDAAEEWHRDDARGVWATAPVETVRTKKVPRNHVLSEATKEHAAQVQVYHEDVPVGRWRQVRFSGALPAPRVRALTERVTALADAVKLAREQANMIEVESHAVGKAVFGFLFGP